MALSKSKGAHYTDGIAKSYALLGSAANKQGKAALATTYFLNALHVYATLDNEESLAIQSKIYLTMGKIYWQHHKSQTAIDFYEHGVELALKAKSYKTLIKLLHNAAFAYRSEGNYGIAIKFLEEKLEHIKPGQISDKLKTFNEMGAIYYSQKNYKDAKEWFNKMLDIDSGRNSSHFRGQALHNLANIYKDESNIAEAWNLFNRALLAFGTSAQSNDLFITYQDMADLALLEGRPEQALVHLNQATPLLDQLPNTPEYFDQYELLAICYESIDFEKSYAYSKIYGERFKSFDSIQKDLISKIEGYKLDLVLANHEKQLQRQAQQKKLSYTIMVLLMLSLIVYLFMDYRKRMYRLKLVDSVNFFIKDTNLLNKL